ncbi:hypothetical protein [Streptomyces fructofermentans]|uniref:Uncharacterized protein n=1 Tax=Streptomyces fructofermentans TaxID=152141 RepID=A0A918NW67_9ACTN|nr:hypothetical protein [Streptomyces fructofermentans]GGX98689.1 hypothetical protein GCM10010515_76180 [Streptomyces fructofermentans]
MDAAIFVVDDSAKDPDAELWYAEPPGFTALPLQALLPRHGTSAGDELRTAVAPLLESAPSELVRQQFIACFSSAQQYLGALCGIGTVNCSIGLHRDDVNDSAAGMGSQPLLSLLTLSWCDTPVAPRGVTAARAVAGVERHERVEFLELPCGPVTVSETIRVASPGSGLPRHPLLQIHAHAPHPDCKRMAVLTLSTTAVARREQYRAILRRIAGTVSFDDPLAEAAAEVEVEAMRAGP